MQASMRCLSKPQGLLSVLQQMRTTDATASLHQVRTTLKGVSVANSYNNANSFKGCGNTSLGHSLDAYMDSSLFSSPNWPYAAMAYFANLAAEFKVSVSTTSRSPTSCFKVQKA